MVEKPSFDSTVDKLTNPEQWKDRHGSMYAALDQSGGTLVKHMEKFGVDGFEQDAHRNIVRQMEGTADAIRLFDGVIVNALPEKGRPHGDMDEFMPDGKTTFREAIHEQGSIVIAKLVRTNKGGKGNETLLADPRDLDTFERDLQTLVDIGAHAVKLRITFRHGMPDNILEQGIEQFGFMHKALAKNGQVMGIYEPEVLFENDGNLQQNFFLQRRILAGIEEKIVNSGSRNYPSARKISYIVPGKQSGKEIDPNMSAAITKKTCENVGIDPTVTPVVHLSGGIPAVTVREIQNELASSDAHHGTSFSRALVEHMYRDAFGADVNSPDIEAGHNAMKKQALLTLAAQCGRYRKEMENLSLLELEESTL